ncbi:hypothetical protein BJ875DRAFT_111868 [Amylocarpus encephaloides]|uniref:BED-type domain-containing protein n=1 Tax=Amylocarpus encephaloides TaxID=45428 RepID=A0A9P7YDE6_9HELO|nr:hypothetical protein BJ875DRAFT_111868 [Amylocarpus encephaloides]
MIQNAGPLPGLAGKKRAREIAESDTSASNEPPSPHQYPYSDPTRASKRMRTAPDESRRRSTPSNLRRSPAKQSYLAPVQDLHRQDSNFNKSYLSAPGWMKQGIKELLGKDPNALMEPDGVKVRCLDCGGVYKTTTNRTFGPVATHLKGKGHIARVSKRVKQQQKQQQDILIPIAKTSDFRGLVERLSVYTQPEATETADLAAQFFAGMQKQASKKAMDISRTQQQLDILQNRFVPVEQKTDASEKKIVTMEQNLNEILQVSKMGTEKHKSLTDQQMKMEKTIKDNMTLLKTPIGNTRDQTIKHEDDIEKQRVVGVSTEARVRTLEAQLRQNYKQNGNDLIKLGTQIEKYDREMKAEIRIGQEKNLRMHFALESLVKRRVDELSTRLRATEEHWHFIATQSQQNASYHSGRAKNNAVFAPRLTTLKRNQSYYTPELPKPVQNQREGPDPLQSELTLLRNQLQKQGAPVDRLPVGGSQQQVNDGRLQQILEDRMATRFAQYDAQFQAQKLDHEARIQRIVAKNTQHTQALESSIQNLKDKNATLESLVPKLARGLAQEVQGLRQCIDTSLESVNDNFRENDDFLETLAEQIAQARRDIESCKNRRSILPTTSEQTVDSRIEEIGGPQERIEELEDYIRRQIDQTDASVCGASNETIERRERIRILEEGNSLPHVQSSDRVVESIETRLHIETLEEQLQKQQVKIEAVLPMCVTEMARLREELGESQIKARAKFNVIAKTFPAIFEDTKQLCDCISGITDFIDDEQEKTSNFAENLNRLGMKLERNSILLGRPFRPSSKRRSFCGSTSIALLISSRRVMRRQKKWRKLMMRDPDNSLSLAATWK